MHNRDQEQVDLDLPELPVGPVHRKSLLIRMLGFALAVSVLLDATVIRVAIGPALLRLDGRWNWWPGG
jgi:uncharacterized membrane protein YdfJ with MMPL/SSD domain